MELFTLLKSNWFELSQTAAIALGFIYTARSFSLESRSRRAEFALNVTTSHREIWKSLHTNPELARILDTTRNLKTEPVTNAEDTFVLAVILHLSTVNEAIVLGLYASWPGLSTTSKRFSHFQFPPIFSENTYPFKRLRFAISLPLYVLPGSY